MDLNDPRITNPALHHTMRVAAEENPSIKYRFKEDIWWWKILYYTVIWWWNKDFMKSYITTVGDEIHFPSVSWLLGSQEAAAKVIAHELVHMRNNKARGRFLSFLGYSFPQILGVLTIPAVLGAWIPEMWWFLVFLVAVLPLPAYWRMKEELSAYRMSIAAQYWLDGGMHPNYITQVFAAEFISSKYYFMWPFKKYIAEQLAKYLAEVQTGEIRKDPLFEKIYQALTVG